MSDEQVVVCKTHNQVEPCPRYPKGCVMTQDVYVVEKILRLAAKERKNK